MELLIGTVPVGAMPNGDKTEGSTHVWLAPVSTSALTGIMPGTAWPAATSAVRRALLTPIQASKIAPPGPH